VNAYQAPARRSPKPGTAFELFALRLGSIGVMNGEQFERQAVDLPQQLRLSAVALVLANLVPLAGVLLWQWSVSSVVILYWFENVIIGIVNVLRMLLVSPESLDLRAMTPTKIDLTSTQAAQVNEALQRFNTPALRTGFKLFIVPFFIVHYFAFCSGHGIFVFSMFGDQDGYFSQLSGLNPLGALVRAFEIFSTPLALAAAALALSHAFSFVQNYLIGGEYRRLDLRRLMIMPYGRIVALHITIIFGGIATMMLGEPIWVLVILVVAKIAVDLKLHVAEHRKAKTPTQTSSETAIASG
jgi:hypothetical protein